MGVLFFCGFAGVTHAATCEEKEGIYLRLQNYYKREEALKKEVKTLEQRIDDIDLAVEAQQVRESDLCKVDSGDKDMTPCNTKIKEIVSQISSENSDLGASEDIEILFSQRDEIIKTRAQKENELNSFKKENKYEDLVKEAQEAEVLCPVGVACQELLEPINCTYIVMSTEGGTDFLKTYISLLYRWIAGIIGFVAVLSIVISGIQISVGGASEQSVSAAKERIGKVFAGLALLFLTSLILYTINPTFFS